jgi:hypothetical protein
MCSAARAFVCLLGMALAARSEEVLNGFRPSAQTSAYGKVSELEFASPLIELT